MSLPIQKPNKAGAKIPVSIDLAAASWGQYALKKLIRFKEGRVNHHPGWEGRGQNINGQEVGVPITPINYWAGRYVLCGLTVETSKGTCMTFNDAIVAVSRENRIVCTPIVGRSGTVKEYINSDDWSINIILGVQKIEGGVIVDDYPTDELKTLYKILAEDEAMRVHSSFLDVFGIRQIVIKSYAITQTTELNYQAVNISALSDETVELKSVVY